MPDALKNFIDWGYTDGGYAASAIISARAHLYQAADAILGENWSDAKDRLYECGDDLGYFIKYLLQDDVFYESMRRDWRDALYWINDNWPANGEEYELTMSKILDAMWDAKPHQCLLFVPMIDAMRGSIWNKTVTSEWMGNALRHFLE